MTLTEWTVASYEGGHVKGRNPESAPGKNSVVFFQGVITHIGIDQLMFCVGTMFPTCWGDGIWYREHGVACHIPVSRLRVYSLADGCILVENGRDEGLVALFLPGDYSWQSPLRT
jgi:hypothetical protein